MCVRIDTTHAKLLFDGEVGKIRHQLNSGFKKLFDRLSQPISTSKGKVKNISVDKSTPKEQQNVSYFFEEIQKHFEVFDSWIKAITTRFNVTPKAIWQMPISEFYTLVDIIVSEYDQQQRGNSK